jgi:hypothetical protein
MSLLQASALLLCIVSAAALTLAFALRRRNAFIWLGNWLRRGWSAPAPAGATRHLMFCFVDHFEPQWGRPGYATECERVRRWRSEYERLCRTHRDADGRPPVHTFFYPEEEYRREHLEPLVELCRLGMGEIEVHLHHDKDTAAGLHEKLHRFVNLLADQHDAVPRAPGTGQLRWAFVHGNWALDNSHPAGSWCGVNNELQVLREEGCYADFTLPAAPSPCQTSTINRIYYATDDPQRPKSHDRGERVRVGGTAVGDLMIIQGPLGFLWSRRKLGIIPGIESGDVRASSPPTANRIDAWVKTGIHVAGRPEWIFVKVHTHGTQERDMDTLLGAPMSAAFDHLEARYNDGREWKLHYVSAREMYNIIKAAEAGATGEPGAFRDYEIPRPGYAPR